MRRSSSVYLETDSLSIAESSCFAAIEAYSTQMSLCGGLSAAQSFVLEMGDWHLQEVFNVAVEDC